MSVLYRCPNCQAGRKVSDSLIGRRLRCPQCNTVGRVAGPEGSESPDRSDEEVVELLAGDEEQEAAEPRPRFKGAPPAELELDDDPERDDEEPVDPDEAPVSFSDDAGKAGESEMDMTPMVDVTFLLLIFFMVTAAFSLQKSIEIPKPEQTDEPSQNVTEPEESPDMVTVQIDEYNTFRVLTADWDKEAPGEIDLLARLREARRGNDGDIVPNLLLVKAHTESLHKRVVMALDAGSATGFDQIQLVTIEGDF